MHSAVVSSSLFTLAALLPISGAAPFAVTSGHDGLMIEDNPLEVAGRTAKRKDVVDSLSETRLPLHIVNTLPVYDETEYRLGSDSTRTKSSAATETAASASKERRKIKISSSSSGEEEEGSSSLGSEIWDGVKDISKGILKGTAVTAGSSILGDIASNEAQSAAASSSTTAAASASTAAAAASKERRKVSSSSSSEEEEGSSSLTSGLVNAAKDFGKSTLVSAGSTILGSEIANEVEKHLSPSTTTAAAQKQRRAIVEPSAAQESQIAKNSHLWTGSGPQLSTLDGSEVKARSMAASLGKATGKKATHQILNDEKNKNKTGSIDDEVKSDLEELKTKITDLLSELENKDKNKDTSSKIRTRAAAETSEDLLDAAQSVQKRKFTLENAPQVLITPPWERRSPGLGKDLLKGVEEGYDLYEDWKDAENQKRSPKLSSLLKGGEKLLEGVEDGYDLYESSQDDNNQKRSPKLSSLLKGGEKVLEGLEDGYDLYESSQDNNNNNNN
ncbi:hypothetical protein SLS53_004999 [Cytospora paraplurivora]|uniref:Uncharacterized protein n=1 Tax=Cytospora paraplurivora TaxID=2898453 RepID=A0AAN9YFL4_9PEZI